MATGIPRPLLGERFESILHSKHQDRYAVLYTADCIQAVAAECGILRAQPGDKYTWSKDLADTYQVARYSFEAPALFIPIDGRNRRTLGLEGPQRRFSGYESYQTVALELYERFGRTVHGLSWESFHRNQPGRVYAIWHDHKTTIQLALDPAKSSPSLTKDLFWLEFLVENPQIECLAP